MSTSINNPVQNHQVWQKEAERSNTAKQPSNTEKSREHDSAAAREAGDRVDIQDAARHAMESNRDTKEIRNADEAQKSVEEVVGLIQSETGSSNAEKVHDLNPGTVIDILV